MRGHAGIPNDPSVQAVVMNVTAVDATGPGYVQVLPTGVAGDYSNLNTDTPGQTIPNVTVVPIGADGSVTIYTQGGAHLLADVSGYFVASGATKGGRYVGCAAAGTSLRHAWRWLRHSGRAPRGRHHRDSEPRLVGQPGAASAVVMNVTAVSAAGWGFVTAYPTGQPLPNASNLNMVRTGQVIANLVIVPVGPAGTVDLTTSVTTHLLADVLGYFTTDSQPSSTAGLYVPVPPHRARDSRLGYPQAVKPLAQDSVEVGVLARGAVPATGVSAVLLNVTATMAEGVGYVTAFASEDRSPLASSLNYDHTGQTIANSAVVKVGGGFVTLQNENGNAFLLADTFGYFRPDRQGEACQIDCIRSASRSRRASSTSSLKATPGSFFSSGRKLNDAMPNASTSLRASTVAVRGPSSMRAISPKAVPGPSSVTRWPLTSTSTWPSVMRKKRPPVVPSSTIVDPAWNRNSLARPLIAASSLRLSPENNGTAASWSTIGSVLAAIVLLPRRLRPKCSDGGVAAQGAGITEVTGR